LRVVTCRFGPGLVACTGLRPCAAAGARFKPSKRSGLPSLSQAVADWSLPDDDRADGSSFDDRFPVANKHLGDAILVARLRDVVTEIDESEIAPANSSRFARVASPSASGRQ
jgi:hypothetical protein